MFNRKSGKKFIFLLFIGLLIVAAISLTCGQIKIPLHNTLSAIGYQLGLPFFDKNDFTQEQMAVVWYIRMPRMVVGLLVGAALGISGAVMQGIFSNPLADPGIIGVSSGAATGAVLSIALGWATESMFVMPAFAFCGSVCAVALTVFLAMRNGKIPVMTLLLAGVAVGMLLGAVTSGLLTFMNEQKLQQYLFWWTAVYSGHHYLIDVMLGISCALLGILVFEQGLMKWGVFKRFFERYSRYIG